MALSKENKQEPEPKVAEAASAPSSPSPAPTAEPQLRAQERAAAAVTAASKAAFPKPETPASLAARSAIPDSEDPNEPGFIQAGYVYYAEGRPDLPYIYVKSIRGDGGLKSGNQQSGNYLKVTFLGPEPDRSRDLDAGSTRFAMLRFVTHRVRHQDLEYPLPETPVAREERIKAETAARTGSNLSYIPQRPN